MPAPTLGQGASEQDHGGRGVCSGLCSQAQPLGMVLLGDGGALLAKTGRGDPTGPELCSGGGGMAWGGV